MPALLARHDRVTERLTAALHKTCPCPCDEVAVGHPLLCPAMCRGQFIQWLGQRYHVHRALEAALDQLRCDDPLVAFVARPIYDQARVIADDLARFGVEAAAVEAFEATERFGRLVHCLAKVEPRALLGALYVLEGEAPFRRHLLARLRPTMDLPVGQGAHYMSGRVGQADDWATLREDLNAVTLPQVQRDALVATSVHTLEMLRSIDAGLCAAKRRQRRCLSKLG